MLAANRSAAWHSECDAAGIVRRAREAADREYGECAGIVGVSTGIKFCRGRPVPGGICIQFFVSRKQRRPECLLPGFVYGRDQEGEILEHVRIPTDVIPVGEIQPACSAGSPITRVGKTGTLTLIFENLHPKASEKSYLAFTAAHVAGDLTLPRPVNP